MAYSSHSILPTGELFRIYQVKSSDASAPVTSSYITDVSIHRGDTLYGGYITEKVWFSNLYTTASN